MTKSEAKAEGDEMGEIIDLESFFRTAKIDIEKKIRDSINAQEDGKKIRYFLKRGKRLRPILTLLAFRACCGDEKDYEKALELAVAIELQHSASLVHDDILDGDSKRRGNPSYHKMFGVEDAILTGHRAIVLGFKNILDHDAEIIETLFDVWDRALIGETEDIESRSKNLRSLLNSEDGFYFDVILNKTASLFAGATKLGSQEAKSSKHLQSIFWEYGKYIGIAYQLADDSYDMNDGKIELLPLSWIAKQIDAKTKESLISLIEDGGLPPSDSLSKLGINAQSIFIKEIRRTQHLAERLAKNNKIPDSEFKPLLSAAPRFIIDKFMERG
jgi:geranylgeranyl pyrophosphate synthase